MGPAIVENGAPYAPYRLNGSADGCEMSLRKESRP
jgi:hypothetical protein